MKKTSSNKLMREQLDRKLKPVKAAKVLQPKEGWIRSIREALGVSQAALARKLGITAQSLVDIEKNEQSGKVSLQTLKRVAEALDCEVFYSMIPRRTLEQKVQEQALSAAKQIVERTSLHMSLENQDPSRKFKEERIKELAAEMIRNNDKKMWEVK